MAQEIGSRRPGRARAARVEITYDVRIGGEDVRKELPVVLGVLGDFAGNPDPPAARLRERSFVDVNLRNFDLVMRAMKPRLTFRVPNRLSADDSALAVTLRFERLEDFEPENVVRQVEPLRKLIELRQELSALRALARRSPADAHRIQRVAAAAHSSLGDGSPSASREEE